MRLWTLIIAAAVGALSLLHSPPARACSPELVGWYLQGTWPANGAQAAPINGAISVWLGFSGGAWPDEDTARQTLDLTLTRDGDERVEGDFFLDPDTQRARFVSLFPLAEGITYTLRVTLRNDLFDADFGLEESFVASFTTGDLLEEEVNPAFSGLQTISLAQSPQARYACCESRPELCDSCGNCDWCWVDDWSYPPSVTLTWLAPQRDDGPAPLTWLLYRYDSPDAPQGALVGRFLASDEVERALTLVQPPGDQGPWCYLLRTVDVYGRQDNNQRLLCADLDDLTPASPREVPPEDRSGCLGAEPDMGLPDASDPDADDVDAPDAAPDLAPGEDAAPDLPSDPDMPVAVDPGAPQIHTCGCQTPHAPPAMSPLRLFLAALLPRR
jgi:hypothetical protein